MRVVLIILIALLGTCLFPLLGFLIHNINNIRHTPNYKSMLLVSILLVILIILMFYFIRPFNTL